MRFSEKLRELMTKLNLTQAKLSKLTGIGRSSISQYLSGEHEPSESRKKQIAIALNMPENYFQQFTAVVDVCGDSGINVPVPLIARLMGKSPMWVMQGLRDGVFPWGYGVKLKNWSYFISSVKFTEYTGIKIPGYQQPQEAEEK